MNVTQAHSTCKSRQHVGELLDRIHFRQTLATKNRIRRGSAFSTGVRFGEEVFLSGEHRTDMQMLEMPLSIEIARSLRKRPSATRLLVR